MSEQASAAAALTGQAAEPAAPAPQPETGNAAPWFGELDQDLTGYVENKGWKNPADAISGYRNLEKLLGADRAGNTVVLPKDGDQEGWDNLFSRLGRPESPDKYDFKMPEGGDETLAGWFRENAHKAGLNTKQAGQLFDAWNQFNETFVKESQEKLALQSEQDMRDLKREWGQTFDANIQAGRAAASKFGFTGDDIAAIEQAIGTKAVLQKFAAIGRGFGEDRFEGAGTSSQSFGITPAAAQAKIAELQSDKSFIAQYTDKHNPGHQQALQKMQQLMNAAYPET